MLLDMLETQMSKHSFPQDDNRNADIAVCARDVKLIGKQC